jgi:hypothetical protein
MENMEDFCVCHNYTQRDPSSFPPSPTSSSSSSSSHPPSLPPPSSFSAALQQQQQPPPPSSTSAAYSAAAAAAATVIALKFHPKHATNKNKTKHIMKISHINVNIYDKTATSQQNSD